MVIYYFMQGIVAGNEVLLQLLFFSRLWHDSPEHSLESSAGSDGFFYYITLLTLINHLGVVLKIQI